mgnify:CR=1 FL=1
MTELCLDLENITPEQIEKLKPILVNWLYYEQERAEKVEQGLIPDYIENLTSKERRKIKRNRIKLVEFLKLIFEDNFYPLMSRFSLALSDVKF